MVTELYPSAFSQPLTMTSIPNKLQGYFRSKLFVASSATNPLLAAAEPLLSLIERLGISQTLPPLTLIHEKIEHELWAFRSRLASQNYPEELTSIAHYFITATIDELLGKNYLRIDGKAAEFKAFTPVSNNEIGPESYVFQMIHRLKERTNQSLNVLELAYFCLITGFEGEFHFRADGRQALENLIEELHQLIRRHRANKPYRAFKEDPIFVKQAMPHKPLFMAGALSLLLVLSTYFGSSALLNHKAATILTITNEMS